MTLINRALLFADAIERWWWNTGDAAGFAAGVAGVLCQNFGSLMCDLPLPAGTIYHQIMVPLVEQICRHCRKRRNGRIQLIADLTTTLFILAALPDLPRRESKEPIYDKGRLH